MIKRVFIQIVLLSSYFLTYSQKENEEKGKHGINISSVFTKERQPAVMLYFEKHNMKHSFFMGTKIIIPDPNRARYYWYVGREFKRFFNRFGLVAGYHYFPNELKKKRNLGFEYLIQTSHYSLSHKEDSTGFIKPVKIEDGKEYTIENLFGYSAMLEISEGFYLNQSAGIGVSFTRTNYFDTKKKENNFKYDTYFKLGFQYIF